MTTFKVGDRVKRIFNREGHSSGGPSGGPNLCDHWFKPGEVYTISCLDHPRMGSSGFIGFEQPPQLKDRLFNVMNFELAEVEPVNARGPLVEYKIVTPTPAEWKGFREARQPYQPTKGLLPTFFVGQKVTRIFHANDPTDEGFLPGVEYTVTRVDIRSATGPNAAVNKLYLADGPNKGSLSGDRYGYSYNPDKFLPVRTQAAEDILAAGREIARAQREASAAMGLTSSHNGYSATNPDGTFVYDTDRRAPGEGGFARSPQPGDVITAEHRRERAERQQREAQDAADRDRWRAESAAAAREAAREADRAAYISESSGIPVRKRTKPSVAKALVDQKKFGVAPRRIK